MHSCICTQALSYTGMHTYMHCEFLTSLSCICVHASTLVYTLHVPKYRNNHSESDTHGQSHTGIHTWMHVSLHNLDFMHIYTYINICALYTYMHVQVPNLTRTKIIIKTMNLSLICTNFSIYCASSSPNENDYSNLGVFPNVNHSNKRSRVVKPRSLLKRIRLLELVPSKSHVYAGTRTTRHAGTRTTRHAGTRTTRHAGTRTTRHTLEPESHATA
jgi:hypothetical protein